MSNIPLRQRKTADVLKDNDNTIVVKADKSLGIVTLGRTVYTTKGCSEHPGKNAECIIN
jgi:hypothetical protein